MAKLIMGYWDCPYCGNQGVPGSEQQCPACGRARGDVKFYMKDNMQDSTLEEDERSDIEYVDEKEAESINRNPDWYCSFCNSLNHDDAEFCTTCGATRKDSEMNYYDMRRKEEEKAAQKAQNTQTATVSPTRSKKPLLILAVIILAIVALTSLMNAPVKGDWTVTETSWERGIQIEENLLYRESGWTLPAGAEQTDARREIAGYESVYDHSEEQAVQRSRQVLDHYETYYTYSDSGNGYFEEVPHQRPVYTTEYYTEYITVPVYRQEPVYQTKYYYNIRRWSPTRDVYASGDDHDPVWPDFELGANEREGQHAERYYITVQQTGKDSKTATQKWRMTEADWNRYNTGDTLSITTRKSGGNAVITDENGNTLATLYAVQ